MKSTALLLLILFTSSIIFSMPFNSYTIRGIIYDSSTKEPLRGVNIYIKNTNLGTTSNDDGSFTIKSIPFNEVQLTISMVGYKSIEKEINLINDTQELLKFELRQSMIEMGSIVITGTNSTHLYEKVTVKTEIIPKKLIQQQSACNLAQALNLQTGVMVENDCSTCNFTQVRILGFDGKYSQVLIDGDPVVSSLGSVYGLEHYPQEMIEQIEIVKGGGSSLYGAGAIAGTINMITRRPYIDRTKISYSGYSFDGSYDQQVGAVAEITNEKNNSGLFVYGSTRNRDSYDRNNDGYTELGVLKNETIGFNGFIKPSEVSEIQMSFHRIFEERRGGSELNKPVHEARIAEMVKHYKYGGKAKWLHKLSPVLEYKINYAFSLLKRDSYYGGLAEDTPEARLQALTYYGYSDNPLHSGGIQLNYKIGAHSFTVGTQYDYDKLTDRSVSNQAYYVDKIFTNLGVFVQDEFSFDKKDNTQIVAGIRFDNHSVLNNWILSPRLNLKHKIYEALTLRAGITTGFKAPQIFDEDLHICGLEGTQRVIRNSVGLKEEKSTSFSFGAEFQDFVGEIPVLFGVTSFYTKLSDAYSDEYISSNGAIEYWERINSSGADVKGIEMDFGIKPVSAIEIRTGFTFKENKYKDEIADFNTKEFFRTPNVFGHFRTTYDFSNTFNAFFSLKYTGKMYIPHEVVVDYQDDPLLVLKRSDTFVEIDIALNKKINLFDDVSSNITLGIKNITNAFQKDLDFGVKRDPGYVYGPTQPRTVYFTVSLTM